MIAERFPDLLQLPVKERLLLAEELYDTVFQFGQPIADDQVFKELQESWEGYLKNPDAAVKWDDLKARLLASRNA